MIAQIDLIVGIVKLLERDGDDLLPRQYNAIIAAANSILKELQRGYTPAVAGCGLAAWLASDDAGASSKWMARKMFPAAPDCPYAHPHDAGDFGRCLTLLQAVPSARTLLLEHVADSSPVWAAIVAQWDALCGLMATNPAEVAERIRQMETQFSPPDTQEPSDHGD